MSDLVKDLLGQIEQLAGRLTATLEQQAAKHDRVRASSRHAAFLTRQDHVVDYLAKLRLSDINCIDSYSDAVRVFLSSVSGLVEWFYITPGPKKVTTRLSDGKAYVQVESRLGDAEVTAWVSLRGSESVALVSGCLEPSVHLLRRLQIAGAS